MIRIPVTSVLKRLMQKDFKARLAYTSKILEKEVVVGVEREKLQNEKRLTILSLTKEASRIHKKKITVNQGKETMPVSK